MLKKSLVLLSLAAACGASLAQALTPIKISYQPSLYWAMPFHVATEKGWWKEVGKSHLQKYKIMEEFLLNAKR